LIVRITADCPVIDPALIDDCVNTLLEGSYDFVCNRLPPPFGRTFPIGLDTEICTFAALETAWKDAKETFHREHVMPYLYEGVKLSAISRQPSAFSFPNSRASLCALRASVVNKFFTM